MLFCLFFCSTTNFLIRYKDETVWFHLDSSRCKYILLLCLQLCRGTPSPPGTPGETEEEMPTRGDRSTPHHSNRHSHSELFQLSRTSRPSINYKSRLNTKKGDAHEGRSLQTPPQQLAQPLKGLQLFSNLMEQVDQASTMNNYESRLNTKEMLTREDCFTPHHSNHHIHSELFQLSKASRPSLIFESRLKNKEILTMHEERSLQAPPLLLPMQPYTWEPFP